MQYDSPSERKARRSMKVQEMGGMSVGGKGRMMTDAQTEAICFEDAGRSHKPRNAEHSRR